MSLSINILHIILGKANPERMNGVNKVVFALASEQARAGWRVAVWGVTADPVANYPARPFTTRLFQAQRNPFALDKHLTGALDTDLPPDTVVHLHGGFVPLSYAVAQRLRARNIPYILTPHGSYNVIAMNKNRFAKEAYMRFFERSLLRHAAVVHCLGQSETVGTRVLLPTANTCLLPYGFDQLPAPVPATSSIPTNRQPPFRVGFCGRLDTYTKGLDALLTGFGIFLKQVPTAELWLIGDGPGRAEVDAWAARLPVGSVTLFGSKYGAEKLALLADLDVFAHPSRNEGLPTAVLEAASLGVPCLVTEATNMGAYIRQGACGEVIGQTDPQQVAAALTALHRALTGGTDGQANGLRERARAMVADAFGWAGLLPKYGRMYEAALQPVRVYV